MNRQAKCITVVAEHDAYVDAKNKGMHTIWGNTEVRNVRGGHVSAYLLRQRAFRDAIRDSFTST